MDKIKTLFIALFLISIAFSNAQEKNSWLGWRGFEKQGVVDSVNIPTKWSAENNVKWKTEIPGNGHSSPVVSGNNIIVTTAYYTTKHKSWLKIIQFAETFILLVLLVLFLRIVSKGLRSERKFLFVQIFNLTGFGLIFGLLTFFVLSDFIFNVPDKSDHITQTYRWYYSGIFIAFCIILISYLVRLKYWVRLILIISFSLITFLIYFLRPYPEYYSLMNDDFMSETIFKSVIIPSFISIIILLSLIFKEKVFENKFSNKRKIPKTLFIFSFIIVVITFLGGIFGINIYRWMFYGITNGNFQISSADLYYRDGYVFIRLLTLGLGFWTAAYFFNLKRISFPKSKWFVIGIIILAILVFIEKNYLIIEKEYVRAVLCIDRNSGEIKWEQELFKGDQGPLHPDNSPASPTPIINDNYIYAYFGSPGLVCLDLNGNIKWQRSDIIFDGIHGVGSSPMLSDGLIIIQNETAKDPYIVAINCETGKNVWKKERVSHAGMHGEHRTPSIISYNGKKIIVTWGKSGLILYGLHSGELISQSPLECSQIKEHVTSVVVNENELFAIDNSYFHSIKINEFINDTDSAIKTFDMYNKGPNCATPAYFNGLMVTISDNGFAGCYDANSGELYWQEKFKGVFMSSVSIINDKVFFSNTSGLTIVVAANKEYNLLSENYLPEPIYASFAPLNNELIIRTTGHLWCISNAD